MYVFQKDQCWSTLEYADIIDLLQSSNTWYIADTLSTPPASVAAVTVLVASAKQEYNTFLKYAATDSLRFLPVWSLEELIQAAPLYGLIKEEVETRYGLVGGIPRYVLEKRHVDLTVIHD